MIETRLLKAFMTVAEELHFGRAAQRLHIAQPALSRQIKLLEDRLGVLLFTRTQRSVSLTPAGEIFLKRAYAISDELARAVADTIKVSRGESGRLAVGFIHSSTYSTMPAILGAFHSRHPDIELDLHELTIWDQLKALHDGVIDVGVLRPPISDPRLESYIFRDEQFVVAVPERHALGSRTRVRLSELAMEDFVLFSERNSPLFHSRIIAMCELAGFVPRVSQQAIQIHTVLGLVRADMGIAVVPDVARNFPMPGLRFLDIVDRPPPVQVALAWRKAQKSPMLTAFINITRELYPSEAL
jgi:DNA-binding transcriptional LysR family regulator